VSKAYLILENGKVFEGTSFGKVGKTVGEVVFNTGMVGYLETITDKNNCGQIIVQTFPMIGNYGVISEDFQSEGAKVAGYVVREMCDKPSNFRCEGTLEEYLSKEGVVGICGLDTRALTRVLREEGTMNGMISDSSEVTEAVLKEIKSFKIENPVKNVTRSYEEYTSPLAKTTVALFDFGTGKGVIDTLLHLDCNVKVFPATAAAEDILSAKPDGVLISDGPGNPKDNGEAIGEIKNLMDKKIPMFGIGLGHQLMALAQGADTFKLPYGHRGASGPCKNLETGVLSIITQNHGFCVVRETLPASMEVCFENANDKTIEGLKYTGIPAFSAQFRPDAGTSPTGEKSLYVKFIELCKEVNFNAVK